MDIVRNIAGDRTAKYQRAALVLRTIGWLSIVSGLIIAMWIWMGLKAGSQLWLWWSVAQIGFGAILLGVANGLQTRAAHFAGRTDLVEDDERRRAA